MKSAFIECNTRLWPVSVLCEVLEVSPSGNHQRRQRTAQVKPHRGRVVKTHCLRTSRGYRRRSGRTTAGLACGRSCSRMECAWAMSGFAS